MTLMYKARSNKFIRIIDLYLDFTKLELHQNFPLVVMSDEDSQDPSVVRCVSRHLGVPPYLLVASALALVLFTLYVIFAVCTTASPPKTKTFKVSGHHCLSVL